MNIHKLASKSFEDSVCMNFPHNLVLLFTFEVPLKSPWTCSSCVSPRYFLYLCFATVLVAVVHLIVARLWPRQRPSTWVWHTYNWRKAWEGRSRNWRNSEKNKRKWRRRWEQQWWRGRCRNVHYIWVTRSDVAFSDGAKDGRAPQTEVLAVQEDNGGT